MERLSPHYNHLIQKIDEFIRKYYLNKVIRGAIYLTTLFLAGYLIVTVSEYYGNFNPAIRTAIFYGFIGINLLIFFCYILKPGLSYFQLGKSISHEKASEIIGLHFQPIKDKLLNTLQLKKLSDTNPEQRLLIEASINQKITQLRPIPFSAAIKYSENKPYLKYALIPLLVIIFIAFKSPNILEEGTVRLVNHNRKFVKKAPFQFVVLNKTLVVAQGDDYVLRLKLEGNEIPKELFIEIGPNTFKMEQESTVLFSYNFKNIQNNKDLNFVGGDYTSDAYHIKVIPKPSLIDFNVVLKYPAYLQKKSEVLLNDGNLTVPSGTLLTWNIHASNTSKIKFNVNNKNLAVSRVGNAFKVAYLPGADVSYSFALANQNLSSDGPINYSIKVIPDLHPSLNVNEQRDSLDKKALYFIGETSDDHGLTKLSLNYRAIAEKGGKPTGFASRVIPINTRELSTTFFYVWDLKKLNINPGTELEYYFEVFDNDGFNGPKSTRSDIKRYRLLSTNEIEKQVEANSSSIKQKISDALRKAGQVEKEAKTLGQELLNKKSLSYDEKNKANQLIKKQADLENLIKEIQQQNKQNMIDQKENNQLSDQLLEKQKQIENLFDHVLDEKTRDLLKNIEKLLAENNKSNTQNELSKVQADHKTIQKELDRLLELYKSLEVEQKINLAVNKLNALSNEQKKLAEQTAIKNPDYDKVKADQGKVKQDFNDIKKDLADIEKKNEALDEKQSFQNPEKEKEQIDQLQKQIEQNLDKKDSKKASSTQKEASEQMEQLAKKLEKAQQEDESNENETNLQGLREILSNLLSTSFDQEKIMQSLKNTNNNDPGYITLTQQQRNVKDNLKMIEDSLFSLSKKVPQIETVVTAEIQSINFNVNKALENLGDRKTSEANKNQQYAMTSINNLALMLSEALDQVKKAQQKAKGGGKGKSKSLSQLSKMQDELNKNMQKTRQQMQQQSSSGDKKSSKGAMSQQLAQMAREQAEIRQAMQEINKNLSKDGKNGLGNLDKIIKDMEQTETDLVYKKIERETLNRQQEIFSKLLEAEKAEKERELDNQRESKSALNQSSRYKAVLTQYQKMNKKELELINTLSPSLNSFYKIKVENYFKFLNSGNK
ncbi:MAG: hypothetical protein JWN56_397 [Sphingobacteriales bacterium]|nr:hypothetical protein [Sphingobacteriales bacterium]